MKWKLSEAHFNGSGEYKFRFGEKVIALTVSQDQTFRCDDVSLPLYAIAMPVPDMKALHWTENGIARARHIPLADFDRESWRVLIKNWF